MIDPLELPLRDIHLPEPVSFWPPAPGWWLLAALIILGCVAGWLLYLRNQQLKLSALRIAREELARITAEYEMDKDPLEMTRQVSTLLRRVSISLFPRVDVASLTGDRWLEFLDGQLVDQPFSKGAGRILADAPYRNRLETAEVDLLLKYSRDWIDAVSREAGK